MLTRRRVSPITEFDPMANDTLCNTNSFRDFYTMQRILQILNFTLLLRFEQNELSCMLQNVCSVDSSNIHHAYEPWRIREFIYFRMFLSHFTHLVDHIRRVYHHLYDDVCVDDVNVFGCLAYERPQKRCALDGLRKKGKIIENHFDWIELNGTATFII